MAMTLTKLRSRLQSALRGADRSNIIKRSLSSSAGHDDERNSPLLSPSLSLRFCFVLDPRFLFVLCQIDLSLDLVFELESLWWGFGYRITFNLHFDLGELGD